MKKIFFKLSFFTGLAALVLSCATVRTYQGPRIGDYQYGGRFIQLAENAALPVRNVDGNVFIQLKINGVSGWYYLSQGFEFTALAYSNPLLQEAKDPKTGATFVYQGRSFDVAGFPRWDAGFFKAEKFLAPVLHADDLKKFYPSGPEGPLDGIIGFDLLSGFMIDKEKTSPSTLHLVKGNYPPAAPSPESSERKLTLYLPANAQEMDAKIKVMYFNPAYIPSLDQYFPPRMFVNLVGLKVLGREEVTLTDGTKLWKYSLQLGPGSEMTGLVEKSYRVAATDLAKSPDLYAEMVRKAFADSKIQSGWVKLLKVELEGDQLVFTLGASVIRPF